jgi:predicted HTH transcriptional regulator
MEAPDAYTEEHLLNLIGITEFFRLEFKSARLLLNKEQAIPELSKTVSAFANSEGGTLVIGIAGKVIEGNRRVAKELDGIDREVVSPEWLEQVIRSNISPALPTIRVYEIRLTGQRDGRVAFVVVVPAGSTAYQANDRRYYARQEFGVEPLPDHEVHLRMARDRIPQLHFEAADQRVVIATDEYAERQRQLAQYHAQTGDTLELSPPAELDRLKAPKRVHSMSIPSSSSRTTSVTLQSLISCSLSNGNSLPRWTSQRQPHNSALTEEDGAGPRPVASTTPPI